MVTVFTPTYNRAYILPQLYSSLCRQTITDFEWVIVDDGSNDDTFSLIKKWEVEKKIKINYIYRENGGKSTAINVGVQNAKGNLFFIVDSDDFITDEAIEDIVITDLELNKQKNESVLGFALAGFCYKKINYRTGEIINSSTNTNLEYGSSLELAFKYGMAGDKAEVFYTDVLRQFPFPEIVGNKFVPEALIWYRIAQAGYKFCIKDIAIYKCDYIADGYTQNFKSNLKRNHKGFKLFYRECLKYKEIPKLVKFKYFIRFLQCAFYEVIR